MNWKLCKVYDLPCHGEVKTKMRYKNNSKFIINIVMSGNGNVDGKRGEKERKNIFALEGKGKNNSSRCVSLVFYSAKKRPKIPIFTTLINNENLRIFEGKKSRRGTSNFRRIITPQKCSTVVV